MDKKISKQESIYRQTDFNPEIAESVCRLLGEGVIDEDGKVQRVSVTKICDLVGISVRTLRVWLAQWPDFALQYQASLYLYADRLVEEAIEIADDKTSDVYVHETKSGTFQLKQDWDSVNRSKLQVETRMKIASKFFPEKYGDSLKINSESKIIVRDETTEGLQLMVRNLIEQAKRQGYDTRGIMTQLGLTEVNLLPEDYRPYTQDTAQKMLEEKVTITVPQRRPKKNETLPKPRG